MRSIRRFSQNTLVCGVLIVASGAGGTQVGAARLRPVVLLTPSLRAHTDPFRGHAYAVEYTRRDELAHGLVRSCNDIDQLRGSSALRVVVGGTLDGLKAIAQECRITAIVGRLNPSTTTFLSNDLPLAVVRRTFRCDWVDAALCELEKVKPAAVSWDQSRSNIVIISGQNGWYASIYLVARGDINNDGAEDMVLDVTASADNGKTGRYGGLVVSKRGKDLPTELLERWSGDPFALDAGK